MKSAGASLTALSLLACVLITVTPSSAGTTGVLAGYVFNADGRTPYANATVSVSICLDWLSYDSHCSKVEERPTDAHGFYAFVSLSPGYYDMSAYVAGTRLGGGCRVQSAVDADTTTFAYLQLNDFSKCICDCFHVVRFGPTSTSSIFSFDARGNLEH
jgi:hypothetical protein